MREVSTGRVIDLRTPTGGSAGAVVLSGDGRHAAYDWALTGSENLRMYLVDLSGKGGSAPPSPPRLAREGRLTTRSTGPTGTWADPGGAC